jgi:hypothetical protein
LVPTPHRMDVGEECVMSENVMLVRIAVVPDQKMPDVTDIGAALRGEGFVIRDVIRVKEEDPDPKEEKGVETTSLTFDDEFIMTVLEVCGAVAAERTTRGAHARWLLGRFQQVVDASNAGVSL